MPRRAAALHVRGRGPRVVVGRMRRAGRHIEGRRTGLLRPLEHFQLDWPRRLNNYG